MHILYYDCFAGISGDMNLGAMIDLGVDPDLLAGELSKLGLDDEFRLEIQSDKRKNISGTRVDVILTHQEHGHRNLADAHPPHRNLRDIRTIIHHSTLNEKVKQTSLAMFDHLARAEAKVHNTTIQDVHFHEVGATDAIVDMVGAAICWHFLDVQAVWSSPVELGGGVVHCAHGIMPVPAPATVELLTGCPTSRGRVNKEATTPTGAAILKTLVNRFTSTPEMVVTRTGYGIGHRDTTIPNILRVHLATVQDEPDGWQTSAACMLECTIDDMTPEALGVAMDVLLAAKPMDVHFTPVFMKKNRPGTNVCVLCSLEDEDRFKRLLFKHTTTLGIRSMIVAKSTLARTFEPLVTRWGTVTMKNALMDRQVIRSKPELEDCRNIAQNNDISLDQVYREIYRDQDS
ncbi:nickel pincer cofactor biosynthesis protein LarC [Desulfoplanes formicivorans]|uniref:Putative nickel insertion protein n=1 Tax=Desulfoplanes formicivorans TaxID=1592317 RepID=A0A194AHD3_9BACT|nr:nickel pincer cofactor biosynthesis protein LarC [Desulfoplanes formicivorans]GAU08496.1 hypothetical protein DPF_1206 [Desulfoplanes formicivorans]